MVLKCLFMLCLLFVLFDGSAACNPGFPHGPDINERHFTYMFQTNCPVGSTNMEWGPSENGLDVKTSFYDCASGVALASVFFHSDVFPYTMNIAQNERYYFEYSMMWPEEDTNCVVSLTSTTGTDPFVLLEMTDQNGIANDDMKNVSSLALNTWYNRRFELNMTLLSGVANLRFGFTCATTWSQSISLLAHFDHIEFGVIGAEQASSILYTSRLNCTSCSQEVYYDENSFFISPPRDAVCNSDHVWVVNRTIAEDSITIRDNFLIHGDLVTNNLALSGYSMTIELDGCLRSLNDSGIVVTVSAITTIYHAQECPRPRLGTVSASREYYQANVAYGENFIQFSPYILLSDDDYGSSDVFPAWIIAVIVVSGVIFIAAVVGLAVGLKRRADHKRKRALEAELQGSSIEQ